MIDRDSTLATVKNKLSEADHFVRAAFNVMRKRQGAVGEPLLLRLGITGKGAEPNYRLETLGGDMVVAIDGANHKDWPEGHHFEAPENWSASTMTLEQLEALLRELTGYEGR